MKHIWKLIQMDQKKKISQEKFNELRKKAEILISGQTEPLGNAYDGDFYKLIHELHTFQIELEIQAEELTRTQQTLMASQMTYTNLYNYAPVGYLTIDKKGIILRSNLKFADMLGHERASLLHQPFSSYIAFEDQDICYRHLMSLDQSDGNNTCELRLKKKDGGFFDAQLESIFVQDDGSDPDRYRITVSDITFRKQYETAIKTNWLQLETILNNIDAYVYIADIETYKIIFANNRLKKLLDNHEMIGGICWQVFQNNTQGPCDFCTNPKLVDMDGNPTGVYIWDFYHTKLEKWFELHDMVLPWTDGKLVRLEIAVDITERKKFEHQQKDLNQILESKVKERTAELENYTVTLKLLMKNIEEEKKEIGNVLFSNFKLMISPVIENLKKNLTTNNQEVLVDILESRLKNILSPFSKKVSDPQMNLTPSEIQVAELIRAGRTNKEMAEILTCSVHTISRHRENIRKKSGLKNQKINLRAFLSTLQ